LVEVRRRLRHGVDFLDRIYRIYRMKKSGGTTFALLAPCSLRPSVQWEGLPPAWPIFQPQSGVEHVFRYSDRFYTGSCLGVALRLPCLIFGSGEDADPRANAHI
jgi:hypothetical protein